MIPFSPPRIDQKIIDEVVDTLRSGWITTGPKTKRFEKELAAYCSAPAVLCLSSATAGQGGLGRILVLADSAHSIGARYKGRRTGALTDVTVFSFHAVKNLTTAEGGAVAFNLPPPFSNEEIYGRLCVKTLHGQNKD